MIKIGYSGGEILKEHLLFCKKPLEKGNKLHKYIVHNRTLKHDIGVIHFRGGWRQYVFQAYLKVDMTRSCHKEIDNFIDKLMLEWRKTLKKQTEIND